MRPLPRQRLDAGKRMLVRVGPSSTIRVQYNVYSVHSRLRGERVEVRLGAESLEVWYAQRRVDVMPRLRGERKHQIDYRHISRAAITEVARGFITAFPDMVVTMDELLDKPQGAEFHWTLEGTNTGPNGTGKRVRISGYEEWRIDADGLVIESRGHFDAGEYERQLKHGV